MMRELMKKRIEKHFPDDQEFILRDPLLFGDYRNAMKEGESRMYEDLLDYDAVFYLFQEVSLLAKYHTCVLNLCASCSNYKNEIVMRVLRLSVRILLSRLLCNNSLLESPQRVCHVNLFLSLSVQNSAVLLKL